MQAGPIEAIAGRRSKSKRQPVSKAKDGSNRTPEVEPEAGCEAPIPVKSNPRQIPVHAIRIPDCEDRVLDGPASGGKGSKGEPNMYHNPRT